MSQPRSRKDPDGRTGGNISRHPAHLLGSPRRGLVGAGCLLSKVLLVQASSPPDKEGVKSPERAGSAPRHPLCEQTVLCGIK